MEGGKTRISKEEVIKLFDFYCQVFDDEFESFADAKNNPQKIKPEYLDHQFNQMSLFLSFKKAVDNNTEAIKNQEFRAQFMCDADGPFQTSHDFIMGEHGLLHKVKPLIQLEIVEYERSYETISVMFNYGNCTFGMIFF